MKLIFALALLFSLNSYAEIASYHPNRWTETHAPAAATQATFTHAAATGKTHVITCIQAVLATGATAQTPVNVVVKDGTNVLATYPVSAPATGQGGLADCGGMNFIGTKGNSMTVQFSAAGVAGSFEAVNFAGYSY